MCEWREIKQNPNYVVSDDGRVRRIGSFKDHSVIIRNGYEVIDLYCGSVRRRFRVHRLVADAFIPNPYNKPEVNHIDGDKRNNRVNNLEWVTRQENIAHTVKCGGRVKKYIKCIETNQIFKTSKEASNINGGNAGNIRKVARNRKGSVNGFHYIYIEKNVALGIQTINE